MAMFKQAERKFLSLCYYRSAQEPDALDLLTDYLNSGVNVDVRASYNVTALNLICLTNTEPSAIDILQLLLQVISSPLPRLWKLIFER